ncbi:TlyA family RNA methyltransferase [Acidobacteriota bacterium]
MKERADKILVLRGLSSTRQKAQALILAGLVFSGEARIEKSGQLLDEDVELRIKEKLPFVGRGGLKLDEALDFFSLSVDGCVAADLGSSTGGFTDCLLQRGARKVYAVDVDIRQFDWKLGKDPRVVQIRKNARYLEPSDFDESFEIVTMDLSFISVLLVLPSVVNILKKGSVLALIKPQFEVGRDQVGKKGIVRDPSLHKNVLERIIKGAKTLGFKPHGVLKSATRGQKGNREFFIHWTVTGEGLNDREVLSAIEEAV